MKPIFKETQDWEKAELLMQPALIRVIDNLRKTLEESSWQGTYTEIQEPYPGYQLALTHKDQQFIIDLWDLCFQVCFLDYHPHPLRDPSQESNHEVIVTIDPTLFNDQGDVEWNFLEEKTQRLITQIFQSLPSIA